MAVPRRPAPVKEMDLEQTAELPVIDFTGTHEVLSNDATVSVATLGVEDSLSRTDTYQVPSLNGAAALADNLRDVEERLHRKSERVATLERELEALRASGHDERVTLEARLADAQAELERERESARRASEEQVAALTAAHAAALSAAENLAAERAREIELLSARHEEVQGRLSSLETRVDQHIATLSTQEKELAQRARRVEELQHEVTEASGLARELGQSRDALAEKTRVLETTLGERVAALESTSTELQTVRRDLARHQASEARLAVERDQLRVSVERQLEQLHRLQGYQAVVDSMVGEREAEIAARDQEIASLRTELLQLGERDRRIVQLESELADARNRLAQQDQTVETLGSGSRALETRLEELTVALASADRSALAQSEALRVAAEHATEIETQLAAEREQVARLTREREAEREAAARELASQREASSLEIERLRAEAAAKLEAERETARAERERLEREAAERQAQFERDAAERQERLQREATDQHERLQAQLASGQSAASEAREALLAQLAEREARLQQLESGREQAAADVAARERAIADREQAVTELLDDQQEQIGRLKAELLTATEAVQRAEGDLQAAEQQLRHLETEQRHREARIEDLTRQGETLQKRFDEMQARLADRDEELRRLESAAQASNAVLGKLQQSIQRLSREDTGARPIVTEPPLENMARLLIRLDGGEEHSYPIARRTTIGRTPDNDIRLDANFVSRHHAVILASNKSTIVEDLNSTNGVVVNGRRVTRQPLQHGDVVSIGTAEFRFELRPLGSVGEPA